MDKRPKRRKSKDNPYELISNEKKYFIKFKDSSNQLEVVEVDKKIFDVFNNFELDDLSFLNEYDRHIEHFEFDENFLYSKGYNYSLNTESIIEKQLQNEELYIAINNLPAIQKRRIKKYYFEDKTLQEIANEEYCSARAVKYSIDLGIEKLKEILKK